MIRHAVYLSVLLTCLIPAGRLAAEDALRRVFLSPPRPANARCYWWWLNGAASKEGITRDFEEMKKQGISGALLFDAGQAGPDAPRGPHFKSDQWRALFKHAVREADRCGIALSVNLCSGWNGGRAVYQVESGRYVFDADWVRCRYRSPYGDLASNWKWEGDRLQMEVLVPWNTTATVYVPSRDRESVTESGKETALAESVEFLRMEGHYAVYAVGSDRYNFCAASPQSLK